MFYLLLLLQLSPPRFFKQSLENSYIIQLKGMKMNLVENAACLGEKLCCALCRLALQMTLWGENYKCLHHSIHNMKTKWKFK